MLDAVSLGHHAHGCSFIKIAPHGQSCFAPSEHTKVDVLTHPNDCACCRYKKYVGDPSELGNGDTGEASGKGGSVSKRDSSALFRFPSDASSSHSSIPVTWAEPSDGDMMVTSLPSSAASRDASDVGGERSIGVSAAAMPGAVSPSSDTDVDAVDDLHTTIDRLNRQMDEQLSSFDAKAQKSLMR